MQENKNTTEKREVWPLIIQLPLICFIPISVISSFIPTNVLNSNTAGSILSSAGTVGTVLLVFAGFPIGMIGYQYAKRHPQRLENLLLPTKILSWINIGFGAIIWVILLLVLVRVLEGAM